MYLFKRRHFLLFGISALTSLGLSSYSLQLHMQYKVILKMSSETVNALTKSNYLLYCFRCVQCWDRAGVPLVWYQTKNYSLNTFISWSEDYEAYTFAENFQAGTKISPGTSYPINLKQKLHITSSQGTGEVKQDGVSGAVAISNETQTQFTCGISGKMEDGYFYPICAFPLFGSGTQVIIPLPKILLLYSTTQVNQGTVIVKSEENGILINLADSPNNQRTVSYDINKGWDWDKASWAETIKASTDLTQVLIAEPPASFNPGVLVKS